MKKVIYSVVVIVILIMFSMLLKDSDREFKKSEVDNTTNTNTNSNSSKEETKKEDSGMIIYIKINQNILTATLENNSSGKAFYEKLKKGDITIDMHDYGNFEKVGDLGFELPTNDTKITTKPGDIILYQGDQITIYYDKNTWNFTMLGHVINMEKEELRSVLGKGSITATFSLNK